ncbi:UNVERIFIED_CONTAM: hypothetical protein Slati_0123200 [Sesamum latifolium]|uniref:Uncharacterized protein n=1 Tax=Sesamum latifolium TaxID=2727402 RepID=A0AAW2Y927_9LAMI
MRRGRADWMAICKTKARRVVDASRWTDVANQLEEVELHPKVNTDNQTYDLYDPNGLVLFVDISEAMQHGAGTSRPHDKDEEDEDEDDADDLE